MAFTPKEAQSMLSTVAKANCNPTPKDKNAVLEEGREIYEWRQKGSG